MLERRMQGVLTAMIVMTLSGVPSLMSACAMLCLPMMAHSAPAGDSIATEMPDCCPEIAATAADPAIRTLTVSVRAGATTPVDAVLVPAITPASTTAAFHDPPVSPPAPARAPAVLRI